MSLEKLLAKIEDDAREEGARAVAAAREEVGRITERAGEEARLAGEAVRASYREKGERERVKIMSRALSEGRNAFLSAQEEVFEAVFAEALRQAANLPEERYRSWIKRTILSNVTEGDEEIVAAPHDRALLARGLLDEINRELREAGKRGELRLSEAEAPCERGVIMRGRKVVNNLCLEAVMRDVRERNEEELLHILFGDMDVRGSTVKRG